MTNRRRFGNTIRKICKKVINLNGFLDSALTLENTEYYKTRNTETRNNRTRNTDGTAEHWRNSGTLTLAEHGNVGGTTEH